MITSLASRFLTITAVILLSGCAAYKHEGTASAPAEVYSAQSSEDSDFATVYLYRYSSLGSLTKIGADIVYVKAQNELETNAEFDAKMASARDGYSVQKFVPGVYSFIIPSLVEQGFTTTLKANRDYYLAFKYYGVGFASLTGSPPYLEFTPKSDFEEETDGVAQIELTGEHSSWDGWQYRNVTN